jgi:hypothetical protein
MPQPTVIRCDDCAIEFELFKDLVAASRCVHGRPHRAVRIHRGTRAI